MAELKIDGRTVASTAAALVAFAGNSLLCRLALGRGAIDAATFSTIRLTGGAAMLLAATAWRSRTAPSLPGSWVSAVVLFLYAIPFSFAYTSLTTGTGALILFGVVQVTMMVGAIRGGERLHTSQWLGLVLALGGLLYLVMPGLRAPSPAGSALMALAGVMWGIYSLRGRGAADPLRLNTGSFSRALPLAVLTSVFAAGRAHMTPAGVALALASGAITSGLGYVLWYTALRRLSAARASIVQLLVPVLAGAGGVVFLGEIISSRLVVSGVVTLGGIALALAGGRRFG